MIALLLAWPAFADSFSVPTGSTPTVAEAVEAAAAAGAGPHTITVDGGKYSWYDDEDSVDVSGLELTIESASAGTLVTLPPILGDEAVLTLNDLSFQTGADIDTVFGPFTAAVGINDGSLTLNRSEVVGVNGVGLLLVNSDLYASEFEARDGWGGRAVESLSDSMSPTLSLLNSTFLRNGAGDIKVLAEPRYPATLYAWEATQEESWSAQGTAVYAENTYIEYHQSAIRGMSTGTGAPIEIYGGSAYFDAVEFTSNYGNTAALLYALTDGDVEIYGKGTAISGNLSSEGVEMSVTGSGSFHIRDASWIPGGYAFQSGGTVQISYSSVLIDEDLGVPALLYSLEGLGSVYRSHICLAGGTYNYLGLIWGKEGIVAVSESIFTGLADSTSVTVRAQGLDTSDGNSSVYFVDNTLVDWAPGSLIYGAITDLTLVNNLFVSTNASASGSTDSAYDGYNLRYASYDRGSIVLTNTGDVSADPMFATPYDGSCDWLPELQAGSPAIDVGDPALVGHDGGPSDIGAIDYGDDFWTSGGTEPDTGDTGDTGAVDTDTGDTGDTDPADTDTAATDSSAGQDADDDGVPDTRDCNDDDPRVFPGAEDLPDDALDQNCDGVEATTTYSGGCGCDTGAPTPAAAAAMALALTLSSRRYRP